MSLQDHAKTMCEYRLYLENSLADPSLASKIKKLEAETKRIPSVLLGNIEPIYQKMWNEIYSKQVIKLEDGVIDMGELPPVNESATLDAQEAEAARTEPIEDSI
jgi:hypothetical protein